MDNIKEIVLKLGLPSHKYNAWLNQKIVILNDMTPQEMINSGQSEQLIEYLRSLLKYSTYVQSSSNLNIENDFSTKEDEEVLK